jgi:sodium/hydrogen antiporter
LSIPLSKFGIWLPRTLSAAVSTERVEEPEPFYIRDNATDPDRSIELGTPRRNQKDSTPGTPAEGEPRPAFKIGRPVVSSPKAAVSKGPSPASSFPAVENPDEITPAPSPPNEAVEQKATENNQSSLPTGSRVIRFPDEQAPIDLGQLS